MDDGFVTVERQRCDLCGACVAVCAPLALHVVATGLAYDGDACTACGDCLITCPRDALADAA